METWHFFRRSKGETVNPVQEPETLESSSDSSDFCRKRRDLIGFRVIWSGSHPQMAQEFR